MKYNFEVNKNYHLHNLRAIIKNLNYSNLLNNKPLKPVLALSLNTCNQNPITLNSLHPLNHLYHNQKPVLIVIIQSRPLLTITKRKSNKYKTLLILIYFLSPDTDDTDNLREH